MSHILVLYGLDEARIEVKLVNYWVVRMDVPEEELY